MTAIVGLALAVAGPVLAQASGICGPLDNGRVANAVYKGNAVFFEPIVRYEYTQAVLTISGPCENIVRTFKPGEQIFFDLSEVKRTLDGRYTWQLRFTPAIDPAVQEALQAARGSGEEADVWWSFWQKGAIPAEASVDSASFSVVEGVIVDPASGVESQKSAGLATRSTGGQLGSAAVAAAPAAARGGADLQGTGGSGGGAATLAPKDFVIIDDLIVDGSACIGFDCVNGESFGFDTIRLKENNLRIKFDDTSTAASFPRNDWQLTANDSANGGASKFSIDDISNSRTPFTVEANARSHSLYVDDGGRIGIRTSTPSTEIHVVDGDTPTLRLQQDGSSGFAPQTWDVAGNETNFFVRDVTNGSQLPFRIRPDAPTSSIDIASSGNVGIGTASADAPLHVLRTGSVGADGQVHIENTNGTAADRNMLRIENNGPPTMFFSNTNALNGNWTFTVNNSSQFQLNNAVASGLEMTLSSSGDMTISGDYFSTTCTTPCAPDYVFEPDYELMPIDELATFVAERKHLPNIPTAGELTGPINMSKLQMQLLEKIEELTLYTLDQQEQIDQKNEELASLKARLARIEAQLTVRTD